jgi:hypothetical protein
MPSSASTRLRFEVQALGENLNSWGDTRLNEALRRIEEGIAGLTTKAISGNVTLTSSNYIADEARNAVLKLTGTPGATYKVTIPAVEKLYFVINATDATQNIGTSGGTAAAVRSGQRAWVHCDGTDTLVADPTLDTIKAPTASVALNAQKITGLAAGTAATDAASLSNRLDQFAAPTVAVDFGGQRLTGLSVSGTPSNTDGANIGFVNNAIASAAAINLPSVVGQSGKYLTNNGTTPSWGEIDLSPYPTTTDATATALALSLLF